jgi:dipeptidyl aminopeptidase/acylaminoacyl peptidase
MIKFHHSSSNRPSWSKGLTILVMLLTLLPLLAACGGPEPTPEILIVTATFTPEPIVLVVTATFTPAPLVAESDTPAPPPPTNTPLPQQPSATEPPPTLRPTNTVTPLPSPPTQTPVPLPTDTPVPMPTDTPQPAPTAKPASLRSYYVVYTSFKGPDLQDYNLWGMNGDGSDNAKILDLSSEPAFSADGNKFAFYHWTDGIYVFNLQNETGAHIVHDGNASFPTWAPNGQRLAYFVAAGQRWIYIVNVDGSDIHQLTPGMRPSWSLQGGFIAYDSCENNKCGIFRINPDGGGKRQLSDDGGGGPAVSPDGKRIVYWSQADGDFEIYVINADGSGRRQLTKNRGNDALPAWSPDGRYIYYLSDQDGKAWAVMAMGADGSNPRKIVGANAGTDPGRGWQYQRITVTWNR